MESDLTSRHNTATLALNGYETAGKGMPEIAKKYVEATQERDEIRREIKILEERASDLD